MIAYVASALLIAAVVAFSIVSDLWPGLRFYSGMALVGLACIYLVVVVKLVFERTPANFLLKGKEQSEEAERQEKQ